MRGRLALLLALAVAAVGARAGDFAEARARFRAEYRRDASPHARRKAIAELAATGRPEAAGLLIDLFDTLERDAARLRRKLYGLREKRRALLERAGTNPRRREAAEEQARRLEQDAAAVDAELAGFELDQAAVTAGLGGMDARETIDWLAFEGLKRARWPSLRRTIALRIATAGSAGSRSLLLALDQLDKPEQLVPLLQALALKGGDPGPGLGSIVRHLGHRDVAVRVAAAHALARTGRPEPIPALIRRMRREPAHSRGRNELARALALLTGKDLGPLPDLWAAWWKANEADALAGRLDLGGKGRPVRERKLDQGRFYGIPQEAERIIYVLDVSGSMEVSLRNPKWVGNAWVPAADDEESRYDAARRELVRAVRQLRPGSRYAVVLYSDHVEPLADELVEAGPKAHEALDRELERRGPAGTTNIYEALDYALRLAGVHPDSARGPARADAIFLISDGSPTDANGKSEDPERTLQAVRNWNALQRVAIHAIGIGRQHNANFLKRLAEENGGEYHAVNPR